MIVWYCGKENSVRWHCHNDPEIRKSCIGFQKQAEMPSSTYMNHSGSIQKAPVCMHIYKLQKSLRVKKAVRSHEVLLIWYVDTPIQYFWIRAYPLFFQSDISFLASLERKVFVSHSFVFECACEVFVEVFDCISALSCLFFSQLRIIAYLSPCPTALLTYIQQYQGKRAVLLYLCMWSNSLHSCVCVYAHLFGDLLTELCYCFGCNPLKKQWEGR